MNKELCHKYPKGVTPTQVKRKYEKMYGEKKSTRLIAHFLHQLNIYGFLNEIWDIDVEKLANKSIGADTLKAFAQGSFSTKIIY